VTRRDFTGKFLGYVIKKMHTWLPEESTEEEMLNIMQVRLKEHSYEIRQVLGLPEREDK